MLGADGALEVGELRLEDRDRGLVAPGRLVQGDLPSSILLGHVRAPAFEGLIDDDHASRSGDAERVQCEWPPIMAAKTPTEHSIIARRMRWTPIRVRRPRIVRRSGRRMSATYAARTS